MNGAPAPLVVSGAVTPPGDKSITHRAFIIGAIAQGKVAVVQPLLGADTRATVAVLGRLGVSISVSPDRREVTMVGRGLRGLQVPSGPLDCRNSGTLARLILGVLAAQPLTARLIGDRSLSRRPMRRVTEPLSRMGARFEEEAGDGLPLSVTGRPLVSLDYRLQQSSAQVKSALLLAGVAAGVSVSLEEPGPSRNHTELLLGHLSGCIRNEGRAVVLDPPPFIPAFEARVPGDCSSAAFLVALALLADRGELRIGGVGLNPTRTGFLDVVKRMGGLIEVESREVVGGEPVGDLVVRPGPLRGTVVEDREIPSLVDEIPILAVLASRAEGETVFRGVGELRAKESDRVAALADNLRAVGVRAEVYGSGHEGRRGREGSDSGAESLAVVGGDSPARGSVDTRGDHRVAMAFSVLGALPGADLRLSERASVEVSYPDFFSDLDGILNRA